jgi:hypothetical protein
MRLLRPGHHGTDALAASLVISLATYTTSGCTSRHQLKELLSAEAATRVLVAHQLKLIRRFQGVLHPACGRLPKGWPGHYSAAIHHPRLPGGVDMKGHIHPIANRKGSQVFQ